LLRVSFSSSVFVGKDTKKILNAQRILRKLQYFFHLIIFLACSCASMTLSHH